MKFFASTLCCVFTFGITAFSQNELRPIDTIICYDISHLGFVETNEKNNTIFKVPFSISIEGTVNTVDNSIARNVDGKQIAQFSMNDAKVGYNTVSWNGEK